MRVFVAGGTGALGRRLVPQLAARGHHVRATSTGPGKLGMLTGRALPAIAVIWCTITSGRAAATASHKRQFPLVGGGTGYTSEWLPYLAACAGAKPLLQIPAWLARPLAGEVAVTVMTEGRGFSNANAKAKRELGWMLRHPSLRQGFKEELA
jgi:NAD(P)-dependent dehydrogenase (short-subunit alcohol dehydrogenase family)